MKYLVSFFLSSLTVLGADFLTGQAARITIGQTTFTSQDTGSPSQYQLGGVGGVASANNTLFVADSNHIQATPSDNRVLIYDNVSQFIYSPTADIPQGLRCPVCFGVPALPGGANIVLGQPDFVTTTPNTNATGAPSPPALRPPPRVPSDGRILAVADTDNNRVLIWKSIPATIGAPADIV